jgi:hypothetical protein
VSGVAEAAIAPPARGLDEHPGVDGRADGLVPPSRSTRPCRPPRRHKHVHQGHLDALNLRRDDSLNLPDTGRGGYTAFNRWHFAQIDREGAILDERWNGGGLLADYVIDFLRRPLLSYAVTREGSTFAFPAAIYGSNYHRKAVTARKPARRRSHQGVSWLVPVAPSSGRGEWTVRPIRRSPATGYPVRWE